MDINNGLVTLLVIGCLVIGCLAGIAVFGGTKIVEVDKPIITEKLIEKECPACGSNRLVETLVIQEEYDFHLEISKISI